MPIYILKRYYNVFPSDGDAWQLARETAFHATSDQKAVSRAQKENASDLSPHSGLVILLDPRGRRLWEVVYESGFLSSDEGAALLPVSDVVPN